MRARALLMSVFALLANITAAQAIFVGAPADRVTEVPIERLLANIERNSQGLSPAQKARAIGRLHLLAYLRQTEKLPAYREPWHLLEIAEGEIGDCATLDKRAAEEAGSRSYVPEAKPGELCEARQHEARPEVPLPHRRPPPNAHLSAAIVAYVQARNLEAENLRTRLALAYAYECARRLEDSRGELRFIMRRGLQLIPEPARATNERGERTYPIMPPSSPDGYADYLVLREAVIQFTAIAGDPHDKLLIATLWSRLRSSRPFPMVTPIFVPLVSGGDMSSFVDPSSDVAFDFLGQGEKMQLGWLTDHAAWLVWDPSGRGRIESGFQMFGSVTWIAFWENGYLPLGSLDDNGDGKIAGAELRGLALWRDPNGNGVSDAGEVRPLTVYGVVALRFGYERASETTWIAKDGVEFADGEVRPTYDWLLHEPQVQAVSR